MKKLVSFLLAVMMLCACMVPVSAEEPAVSDQVKEKLYEWVYSGWSDPMPSMDTLIIEDALGNSTNGNYLIYHAYSTEMVFTDAYIDTRIGDRMLSFTCGNTWFAVCEMKNGKCVDVHSLEKAYEKGIINDAILDRLDDPCHTMRVSIVGDVDHSDTVDVADLMGIKDRIMVDDVRDFSILQDVDGDGFLNVSDILSLKNRIMDGKFLKKAKTYDEVYAEKLAEIQTMDLDSSFLDVILFSMYPESDSDTAERTPAHFGLSDEYTIESIAPFARIYAASLPEATPECAAELMAKLQMHPFVKNVALNT